ncbi:3605_t:CDS:2 [Diversispora eburnea]|uniref:3605_t:CDS:1 n=1 Tax=Diversispora eburnea TaxID=1213867 RepID=A0A9N9G4U7_9GLOM|nr:3605_t:CDS:2 [Diversispora eburnea]
MRSLKKFGNTRRRILAFILILCLLKLFKFPIVSSLSTSENRSPLVNSLLGTLYISSIPNFILYFVPPDIKPSSLNSLVSFAVGGLLGDVFLHLLPHSFLGENDENSNETIDNFIKVDEKKNVIIGLAIFTGLMIIKLSAYLNLFADATHNFTDGLAMAASFYTSPSIGATTTVAVFFHEIPHEIGDYAILIQSGFTKRSAMFSQFITAIGAFLEISGGILGTGIFLGDLIIPFTAGGFLYIATVGVIPELLEISGKFNKDIKQAITEFIAMFIGIGMMTIIAWNGEKLSFK